MSYSFQVNNTTVTPNAVQSALNANASVGVTTSSPKVVSGVATFTATTAASSTPVMAYNSAGALVQVVVPKGSLVSALFTTPSAITTTTLSVGVSPTLSGTTTVTTSSLTDAVVVSAVAPTNTTFTNASVGTGVSGSPGGFLYLNTPTTSTDALSVNVTAIIIPAYIIPV